MLKEILFIAVGTAVSYGVYKDAFHGIDNKIVRQAYLEKRALELAKRYRLAKINLSKKSHQVQKLESKVLYMDLKNSKRSPASHPASKMPASKAKFSIPKAHLDFVDFKTYHWDDKKLLSMALQELDKHEIRKSAQFFLTLIREYPKSSLLNEAILLKAAMTCYESQVYLAQASDLFQLFQERFPNSKNYLQAKLWFALSLKKQNRVSEFKSIVEVFRKKYRNTREWKIISRHYEKIATGVRF